MDSGQTLWQKNFTFLYCSKLVKVIADSFAFNSILWFLILDGQGAIGTALLIAVTILPQVLIAPLISPLMKTNTLKFWMFSADITRSILMLLIPFFYFNGFSPLWFIISLMLIHSATGASYDPASVSLIPQIVTRDLIQKANATIESSVQVVKLAAVMFCGILIAVIGAANTMLLTFPLYIISASLVFLIKYKLKDNKTKDKESNQKGTYMRKLKRGFVLVRNHQILFPLAIYCIFLNLGAAPWEALSAVYISEDLNGGSVIHSFLRVTTAIGAFLMGFILTKVRINRYGLLFVTAGIVEGTAFFITGMNSYLLLVLTAAFVLGSTISAINVPEHTIIQTSVAEEDQPQVFAVIRMTSHVMIPLGALVSGYAATVFGAGKVIAFGGLVEILAGVSILTLTKLSKTKRADLIKVKEESLKI
ncbi:MFS transporter [Bacillus glycinifermentans]|uniref:MFS transporter n=1 Tax=Bacillus glycinifermentans TaxID=1664069 RepID=A0A0T6BV14_9BACI|nr:MFS transporter [Bacillus glycinifermentans]AUS92903.1 tetratricopeptide repeat-containing protein [Bacillus glycinifermentans]KRT95459.1 MFS transporter [Bacillus glycinifermentans]MEC0483528.1 MFS transporter [Bacillus glycinifermentans]